LRNPVQVVREARRLLVEMGISGPPTPIDDCVAHADLTIERQIPLGSLPPDEYRALLDYKVFELTMERVFGLYDPATSKIYLKADMTPGRRNFVTLHEVGHGWMPWQRLMAAHPDGIENLTLTERQRRKDENEWQANVFATETLFQLDRFEIEAKEMPFELQSAVALATRYGASIHASLRRYVELHEQRAILLVLEALPTIRGSKTHYRVLASHWSPSFHQRYRRWRAPKWISETVVRPLLTRKFVTDLPQELYIEGDMEVIPVDLQGLHNAHNLLLFGRPKDGQRVPHRAPSKILRTR